VIDPTAFGELSIFKQSVDTLASDISQSEKLPGTDRIWLPGEQSHERRRQAHQSGIAITPTLIEDLSKLAQELGISPLAATA
jgi:L-2-hydroxycarboxylate dehydrogenase (NAD+)